MRIDHGAIVRRQIETAGQKHEVERTPSSANPATNRPVMAPARNASSRPPASELIAACAVRTLARTETFMPMKPAAPDRIAPIGKTNRDQPAEQKTANHENNDADDRDRGVLPPEIGLCALAHRRGYFLHFCVAGIGAHDRAGRPNGVDQGEHAA